MLLITAMTRFFCALVGLSLGYFFLTKGIIAVRMKNPASKYLLEIRSDR